MGLGQSAVQGRLASRNEPPLVSRADAHGAGGAVDRRPRREGNQAIRVLLQLGDGFAAIAADDLVGETGREAEAIEPGQHRRLDGDLRPNRHQNFSLLAGTGAVAQGGEDGR